MEEALRSEIRAITRLTYTVERFFYAAPAERRDALRVALEPWYEVLDRLLGRKLLLPIYRRIKAADPSAVDDALCIIEDAAPAAYVPLYQSYFLRALKKVTLDASQRRRLFDAWRTLWLPAPGDVRRASLLDYRRLLIVHADAPFLRTMQEVSEGTGPFASEARRMLTRVLAHRPDLRADSSSGSG